MTYDEVMEDKPLITLGQLIDTLEDHGIDLESDEAKEAEAFCKTVEGYRGDLLLEWLGY